MDDDLDGAQRLQLKVSRFSGHRQYTESVGMSKTTLPALNGDNGRPRCNDVQFQCIAQAETDTVIHLG